MNKQRQFEINYAMNYFKETRYDSNINKIDTYIINCVRIDLVERVIGQKVLNSIQIYLKRLDVIVHLVTIRIIV